MSGITAAAFAPISIAGSNFIDDAFAGGELGLADNIAKFVADFIVGSNLDLIQLTIDMFLEELE